MSVLNSLENIKSEVRSLEYHTRKQQAIYFTLVDGLVKLGQQHRVAKNYPVADAIRGLLNNAGVTVRQGTDGFPYAEIPSELAGRSIGDTWDD